MSATDNDQESPPVLEGPGKQLRDIRIAKELDIARAAALLHLDVALLESLEADDYSKIPGTVFAQGYLRKYARLLDTPVEPILEAFHQKWPSESMESDLSVRHLRPEVRSSHTLVRLITWLIVLGLIGLVFIWWRGYLQWPVAMNAAIDEPVMEAPAENEPAVEPALSLDGALPLPGSIPQVESEIESAQPQPEIVESLAVEAPVAAAPEVEGTIQGMQIELQSPTEVSGEAGTPMALQNSLVVEEPVTDATEPVTDASVASVDPVNEAVELEQEAPLAATQSEQPMATSGIEVFFSDNCWTDIKDASGRFRVLGNKAAGDRLMLAGEPPYEMVFGNAQAVTIMVEGTAYDLTPHVRGNVARLTLNPES